MLRKAVRFASCSRRSAFASLSSVVRSRTRPSRASRDSRSCSEASRNAVMSVMTPTRNRRPCSSVCRVFRVMMTWVRPEESVNRSSFSLMPPAANTSSSLVQKTWASAAGKKAKSDFPRSSARSLPMNRQNAAFSRTQRCRVSFTKTGFGSPSRMLSSNPIDAASSGAAPGVSSSMTPSKRSTTLPATSLGTSVTRTHPISPRGPSHRCSKEMGIGPPPWRRERARASSKTGSEPAARTEPAASRPTILAVASSAATSSPLDEMQNCPMCPGSTIGVSGPTLRRPLRDVNRPPNGTPSPLMEPLRPLEGLGQRAGRPAQHVDRDVRFVGDPVRDAGRAAHHHHLGE